MSPGEAAAYLIGTDAEGELNRWQEAIRRHDWTIAWPYASSLVTQFGLPIEKDSPEYQLLCHHLMLASAELHAIRSLGDWSDGQTQSFLSLDRPVLPPPATTVEEAPAGRPIKELMRRFLEERKRLGGTTAKRLLDFRAALGDLRDELYNRPGQCRRLEKACLGREW